MFDLRLAFAQTAGDQIFRIDVVVESRE